MNKLKKLQMNKNQSKLKFKDFEFEFNSVDLSPSVSNTLLEWTNLVNKSSRENRISNLKKLLNGK